jgi:3-oxoacyl-[acyl-carrier protein] reductase
MNDKIETSSEQPTTRLQSRVAIVTGGASGIGQATCYAFAREGAQVVAVDLNSERLDETLAELNRLNPIEGGHLALCLDVSSEQDMTGMVDQALEKFGSIDILVSSAGILRGTGQPPQPLMRISTKEWDQVLGTNLKGMFLSNRAVLPAMMKRRQGNIINLSSVSGKQGRAFDAPYCASKFGVIGMSESLAEEVRNSGIRVQIVIPDAVDTPIWDQNGPVPKPPNALPPERVAELILYLVTQPSDTMVMGAVIAPFGRRRGVGAKHENSKENSDS